MDLLRRLWVALLAAGLRYVDAHQGTIKRNLTRAVVYVGALLGLKLSRGDTALVVLVLETLLGALVKATPPAPPKE